LVLLVIAAACGGKRSSAGSAVKEDAATLPPPIAPIAMPPLGVDRPTRMNFIWDAGAPAYEKASAARKKKDWAAVKAECDQALAKDPLHLDAHWLLGVALAHAGEHAAAVDHLVLALAGDYFKYGPTLATETELGDFLATQHGRSVAALALQIRAEYARRVAAGTWLVARRSTFKWGYGVQASSSRGELYAFDRESRRYLRLSHTDHEVVAFVRSTAGDEAVVVGFDKVDRPKADDAPPLFARPYVVALDAKEWKPLGPRVVLPAARQLAVGYNAGDKLLVQTAPASGRWTIGQVTTSSIDRSTGKLAPADATTLLPRVELSLEDGGARRPPGVKTTLAGDGKVSAMATTTAQTIAIPESGLAAEATIATSPDGARVAFATYVDPCDKDRAPSLYVADLKAGTIRHVLSAHSRFATRWIDATTLAYEDGDNAIRLWDVQSQRETHKLDDRAGIALDVLPLSAAPPCKGSAQPVEPAGSAGSAGSASDDKEEAPP
jgi:hypothetical protein